MLKNILFYNILTHLININIIEFTIKDIDILILNKLYPNNEYNELLKLNTEEKDYKLLQILRKNVQLKREIDREILNIYNYIIEKYNIIEDNILESNQKHLIFKSNNNIYIRFKDEYKDFNKYININYYNCLFNLENKNYILYNYNDDFMKIKLIDENINDYYFVKTYLKRICYFASTMYNKDKIKLFNYMKNIRISYINTDNNDTYRDIMQKNRFLYYINNNIQYSDVYLRENDNCILDKNNNYINFILPLIRSFI